MDSNLKKIELLIRKSSLNLLSKQNDPVKISTPIPVFSNAKKILLIRHDRIGDVIISSGIVKILRGKMPDARIDIILSNRNQPAKGAIDPYCDNIYLYSKNLIKFYSLIFKLKKNKYDVCIDLFDNPSSTASFLCGQSGAKYKLGIDKSNRGVYTHVVQQPDPVSTHIIERTAQVLLPFGINPEEQDLRPVYELSDKDKKYAEIKLGDRHDFRLGINLSGSTRNKFWGVDNFVKFIHLLGKELNLQVFFFATEDYNEQLVEILKNVPAPASPYTKTLNQYAAMLHSCDMILAPDTAAVHLASAFKIPVVVINDIYINPKWRSWLPYKVKHRTVVVETGSLSDVKPEDVVKAVKELYHEINHEGEASQ